MKEIFDKRGMIFFVVYVIVAIAVTAFIAGSTDGEIQLTNPIWILGSGVLATYLFGKITRKTK